MLLLMIFLHILDDFKFQGYLANMKQKSWWKENAPDKLYKYDYIVSLVVHSFSWAFMVMLPYLIKIKFDLNLYFVSCFVLNIIIHSIVDDLKANKRKINLFDDQAIHLGQIFITYFVMEHMMYKVG